MDDFIKIQQQLDQAGAAMGSLYQCVIPALGKAYKQSLEEGFNEQQAYGLVIVLLQGFLQQIRKSGRDSV